MTKKLEKRMHSADCIVCGLNLLRQEVCGEPAARKKVQRHYMPEE